MVRADLMWRILAVTAALVFSASLADAGGASGGSGGVIPHFKCYLLQSGDTLGHVVDLVDPQLSGAPDPQFQDQRVRVGTARLFCRPVEKNVVQGETTPDPDGLLSFADNLTCYDIRPTHDPDAPVTLTNQLSVDHAKVRWSTLLCVPTLKDP